MKQLLKEIFSKSFIAAVLVVTCIPPIYFFFLNWLVQDYDPTSPTGIQNVLVSILFSFSITAILFIGNTRIMNHFEATISWKDHWRKRLLLQGSAQLIFTLLAMTGLSFMFLYFNPKIDDPVLQLFQNNVIAVIITLIITLINESKNLFKRWKESLLEAEKLKRQSMEAQFEALKGQLNPHFMFNSLNALSSLIYTDTEKAERFISEFSKIYRYVLEVKDKRFVGLKEELNFLNSFIFLNKIRFDKKLIFECDVPTQKDDIFLPPLAIQTVIENCIKHNEISSENPLHILVSLEANYLVVKNNFLPRNEPVNSNGIGQENLTKRYEIIGGETPLFFVKNNEYVAKLPIFVEE